MATIRQFQEDDLEQLQSIMNVHLGAMIPGWALPLEYIASRLVCNPDEYVTDPWVKTRRTLVAIEKDRLVGAVHLLTYREDTPSAGLGDICWFLCWPGAQDAGRLLLEAACSDLLADGANEIGLGQSFPVPTAAGVADCWSHLQSVLRASGFAFIPQDGSVEIIYGGPIPEKPVVSLGPPISGLQLARRTGRSGPVFAAVFESRTVASVEFALDLSKGGRLPAFAGWAELAAVETQAAWRNRGVGSRLLAHAVEWLRFGGYSRLVMCVEEEAEGLGAGRFYQRFGWQPLARLERGWHFPGARGNG